MTLYSAHFDESGHPSDSKNLIIAGGLGSVSQWKHFEREWIDVLTPFGVTVFHAVDFEQRKPPFDRVKREEARELNSRLAGIICRRLERVISHCVNITDYDRMNAKWLFAECYGAPYPMAARSCISGVEEWARKHSVDINKILLFFEDGAQDKGQLEWVAERDCLPMPAFRKKSELVPLQAGDFIAWHLSQVINGRDKDRYSEAVVRRIETIPTFRERWI